MGLIEKDGTYTPIHTPLLSVNFTFLRELRIGANALHSPYLPYSL